MNETLHALLLIQADAEKAIQALADEKEREFTEAILQLHFQSTMLSNLVTTW